MTHPCVRDINGNLFPWDTEYPLDTNSFIWQNPTPEIRFFSDNQTIATISKDGVMRFAVEASDENAAKFIECIERVFNRRLTGVDPRKI